MEINGIESLNLTSRFTGLPSWGAREVESWCGSFVPCVGLKGDILLVSYHISRCLWRHTAGTKAQTSFQSIHISYFLMSQPGASVSDTAWVLGWGIRLSPLLNESAVCLLCWLPTSASPLPTHPHPTPGQQQHITLCDVCGWVHVPWRT